MLTLVAVTFGVVAILILSGIVPATFLAKSLFSNDIKRGPLVLGLALGIGFAFSAVAASWSFGLLGANSYASIFIGLFLASFLLLLIAPVRRSFNLLQEFTRGDAYLLILPVVTSFYARPYWQGIKDLRISAGNGPDIPQNLMTVLAQPKLGATWTESKNTFLNFLGDKSLTDAIYHLFQLPSMQQQAGVDYLVYGTRWGLSIPFAQLLRVNPELIVIGQATTLSVGIFSLGLIIYGFSRSIFSRQILSVLLSLAVVSNAPLAIQVFNGGMAQAWGLSGIAILSISVVYSILLTLKGEVTGRKSLWMILIAMTGWLANAVTYLDSTMTLAAVLGICITLLAIFASRVVAFELLKTIFIGGVLAALVVAPYTFAALSTLKIRLTLAAGTGIMFNHWPLPSEMLGIFNIWTGEAGKPRDPMTLILGVVFSVGLLYLISRGLLSKVVFDKTISILGVSIILVCLFVAIWAKNSNVGSNYSYIKVATYLTPLLLIVIAERMSENLKPKHGRNPKNDTPLILRMSLPFAYLAIMISSTIQLNSNLIKTAEFSLPPQIMPILNNEKAQSELSEYNYLTSYRALSNVLGFVGETFWISKAPNDLRLESRMSKELRIICLNGDNMCSPKTPEILETQLNQYGFRVFESPITTSEFAKLAPRERYYAAMDAVGQQRFEVPERFIGGNPLLNP